MNSPAIFVIETVLLLFPIRRLLIRARWTRIAPRSGIALWQAIGFATGVAVLGGCLVVATAPFRGGPWHALVALAAGVSTENLTSAMTPNQLFGLTAGLIVATLLAATLFARFVGNSRLRTRHRRILDLVGNRHPAAPGAVVVDHPSATAYCLPGFRSRIVISSGAIAALSDDELSAVLAHERAHVHGRHHLVLLPFRALSSALPGSRVANAIFGEVQELVEMAADDRALRGVERGSLARALCRLTTIDLPAGALGASATATGDRVNRALAPRGHGGRIAFAAAIATAIVFSAPCITLLATVGAK